MNEDLKHKVIYRMYRFSKSYIIKLGLEKIQKSRIEFNGDRGRFKNEPIEHYLSRAEARGLNIIEDKMKNG